MTTPVYDVTHAGAASLGSIRAGHQSLALDGALHEDCLAFCRDLAAASCRVAAIANHHGGLANGRVGAAMYLAAWHRASSDEAALAGIASLVEASFDEIASMRVSPGWIDGFTGATWALRQLSVPEGGAAEEDFSEAVDQALAGQLDVLEWRGHYDLVSGLVGIGLYALEHPVHVWRERFTGDVLRHLSSLAQDMPLGTTWLTRRELLSVADQAAFPDGNYNLGLAHGVSGVIGFLARCVESHCHPEAAASLLVGAMNWMTSQSLHPPGRAWTVPPERYFAYRVDCDQPARLAWCYGDLGVCMVLLRAANALGRDDWRDFAFEVAHASAGRSAEASGVTDMGLCHGSAGAALIFLRLWQQSGDAALADASRFWLRRTLAMRGAEFECTAGVFAIEWKDGNSLPVAGMGYLTGAAGVGLAVLSCITGDPHAWDAPLLTDLPNLQVGTL